MTEQSNIETFVEWAKGRLDEMSAAASALEAKLGELEGNFKTEAEAAVTTVKQWVVEGEAELKKVQAEGMAAVEDAKAHIETMWREFETKANQWVDTASNQQETFRARADAQVNSWQATVDQYVKYAAEMQTQYKAEAETEVERLKTEAGKAQAQLEQLGKAGAASWAVLCEGLDASRKSLEKATNDARAAFNKAAKG
jgi:hypothetical protein